MQSHRPLVLAVLLASLLTCVPGQERAQEKLFTISISAPTSPKDVQVRYFLTGEFGLISASSTAADEKGQLVIRTEVESKPAKSFKAIAYAPGCQFVVINVEDLSTSNRQGQFECQSLPKTLLQGRVPASSLTGKDLQVEVLYVCDWAAQFFQLPHGAISPLSLGKVPVATDGSFAVELPDFAGDPLWSTFSSNATLMFYLVDASNGQRINTLTPPADLSNGNHLKVASSYNGEIQFTVHQ